MFPHLLKLRIWILSGSLMFLFVVPATALGATFILSTNKESLAISDTFVIDVKIDSEEVGINAAQGSIKFPPDILQVESVDKSGSVFAFWLQEPTISNSTGIVSFTGGAINGVSGKSLELFKIKFKVKGVGTANLVFDDSAITASDGSGTNVLSTVPKLQLTSTSKAGVSTVIKPVPIVRMAAPASGLPPAPQIVIPLYPSPDNWYGVSSKFLARWDLPKDIIAVAVSLNREPLAAPTASDSLFDNEIFPALDDGISYLHVRFKNGIGFGPTAHYKIAIDTVPPLPFDVGVKEGVVTNSLVPTLTFETHDQPSGVDFFDILVDGDTVGRASSTATSFTLPVQPPGSHTIVVRATDKAGNRTEKRFDLRIQEAPLLTIGGFRITQFVFFMSLIVMLLLGIVAGWHAYRIAKRKRLARINIAQRDVQTAFNIIKKGIIKLLDKYNNGAISAQKAEEMRFLLERMKAAIDDLERYVMQNVGEIER